MKTSEITLCITFLWTAALQLQRSDAELDTNKPAADSLSPFHSEYKVPEELL